MTYRLRTLGGLALDGEGGPARGAGGQRRTLALLALIATSGERGIARDKLLAYLWPDSESEKARHTLTQNLYTLRRDLKEDALFQGTTELRINPEILSVDVLELEAALDRGDLEHAVSLYAGPFLDGFFLGSAPEFERWVDGERSRLADRVSQTLETLANRATERADHRSAVEHWRRLAMIDPYSSRIALGLMRALAAAGDRAGALQHGRVHEALLRAELELPVDPAVERLAAMLRDPVTTVSAPPAPQHAAASAPVSPSDASQSGVADGGTGARLLRRSSAALSALRRTGPRRLLTSTTLRVVDVARAEKEMAERTRRQRLVWSAAGSAIVLLVATVTIVRCS